MLGHHVMQWVLILLIAGAVIMVGISLVRGLIYFSQASDAVRDPDGVREMHLKSNQMMFARVKWQALVLVLLVVIGLFAAQ
jgi:hypothetical protein